MPKAEKEVKPEVKLSLTSVQILEGLNARIIGQKDALEAVVPYIMAYTAGLTNDTRPVASVLLLGPTGTGKTRTVEALAGVLHGDEKKILRIDCGQFALQHEVAKLLGAPPGYLGHRETTPLITQKKLNEITSDRCSISIVLFDELEKAHPSVIQMLLSITDKAVFTLGDNTVVNFGNTILFFTTNLGAREMQSTITPEIGFAGAAAGDTSKKLERIGMVAVRKKFTPEFINRLDEMITYQPLSKVAIQAIYSLAIDRLRENIYRKYGEDSFLVIFTEEASGFLISQGFSERYGARELNRVIFRQVTRKLSDKITTEGIAPGAVVRIHLKSEGELGMSIMDEVLTKRKGAK